MVKRTIRLAALAAVLTLALASALPVAAQTFEEALAAYERGDYDAAYRGFRPLAEQGDAIAQNNLGYMYDNGKGVPQDYAEAVKWYRLAAGQGYAAAQNNLGLMYKDGHGVPQDYVRAHMWLNLAASRYPATVKKDREEAARDRDRVARLLSPEALARAQRMAREWRPAEADTE